MEVTGEEILAGVTSPSMVLVRLVQLLLAATAVLKPELALDTNQLAEDTGWPLKSVLPLPETAIPAGFVIKTFPEVTFEAILPAAVTFPLTLATREEYYFAG